MSEAVTAAERAEFFRNRFGSAGNQPVTERHGAAWRTMSLGGRPIAAKGTAEYRAVHRALPRGPMTPSEWEARLEAILAEAAESERRWSELGL
jgi:hypothetical protein